MPPHVPNCAVHIRRPPPPPGIFPAPPARPAASEKPSSLHGKFPLLMLAGYHYLHRLSIYFYCFSINLRREESPLQPILERGVSPQFSVKSGPEHIVSAPAAAPSSPASGPPWRHKSRVRGHGGGSEPAHGGPHSPADIPGSGLGQYSG